MPRVLPTFVSLLLCCALVMRASAQEMIPIYQAAADIHEPQLRPEIDGKLNDSVWLLVFGLRDFVALMPGAEGAAVVPSEVMLAHDKEFLYIGLRAYDPKPAEIRANFGRRDRIDEQDDRFTVFIDPQDSGKSAQFFMINANGVMADGLFYSDAQRWDFTPDFTFEGAAQQDQQGWSAELKIPLAQLQFGKQEKNWRLVVMRHYVRNKEWQLRSLPLVRNQSCYLCVTNDVALREFWPMVRNAPLELKTALQESDDKPLQKPLIKTLDFSMRPHESIVFEGSFRPSAGENTLSPKINAGRQFASASEEERGFFLANADLFPYLADSTQPANMPVYTPSISALAWGVRASTRSEHVEGVWLTSMDYGGGKVLLPSAYQTSLATQPASMVSIGHARFSLGGLKIGALFSDRDYHERGYNRVLGQDLSWQMTPYFSVRAHWLHSQTTARLNAQGELDRQTEQQGSAQRIEYIFRSKRWEGVFYSERVSPQFRADNGFFGQVGYLTQFAQLTHKLGGFSAINEMNLSMSSQDSHDWQGNILRHGVRPALKLQLARETSMHLEMASNEQQRVVEGGQLHSLSFVTFEVNSAPSNWLQQASARLNVGDKVDPSVDQKVKGNTLEIKLGIQATRHIDVKMYWLKEWLRNSYVQHNSINQWQRTTDSAMQLQANWEIDPSLSLHVVFSRGKASRNPALYEHGLELLPFDDSLANGFSLKKSLAPSVDMVLGVSRARLQTGKNDAYLKFLWRLE